MTILSCLSQCNFEQWAREESLERPTSSKPKPKSLNLSLENVCLFQVAYTSSKMHMPLKHAPLKAECLEGAYTQHTPLRDISYMSLIFPYKSQPIMWGVDRGQLRFENSGHAYHHPPFPLYIHPYFTISRCRKILTKTLAKAIVVFPQNFWLYKLLERLVIFLEL